MDAPYLERSGEEVARTLWRIRALELDLVSGRYSRVCRALYNLGADLALMEGGIDVVGSAEERLGCDCFFS